MPASGLVTALEPILRACDGTWIAPGTGNADRDTVDADDHVRVPPDHPQYTLRRVWLTEEEERGFYYGFANEGIWPLCHIAHTRPVFAPKTGGTIATSTGNSPMPCSRKSPPRPPVVLVPQFHFALLPRDDQAGAARRTEWQFSGTFPGLIPEAFGICPWQRELLDGLLGANLIGFHIQAHCNNFLDRRWTGGWNRGSSGERFAVNRAGPPYSGSPVPDQRAAPGTDGRRGADGRTAAHRTGSSLLAALGVEATFDGGWSRQDSITPRASPNGSAESREFLENWPVYRGTVDLRANRFAEPDRDRPLSRPDPRSGKRSGSHQSESSRPASGNPSYCSSGSIATGKSCPTIAPRTFAWLVRCTTA